MAFIADHINQVFYTTQFLIDRVVFFIIGKYSKNEITVYDETFDLEKPVFSKMKLTKKNDSKYEIKISCYGNRITIEEKNLQVSDVIKLWLIMKGAERVIQRNKNADSIFEAIQIGG